MKGMNDYQSLGSGITYMRRYGLSAMLGLVTDEDKDACGQQEPAKKVTDDQLSEIAALMIEIGVSDEQFLSVMGKEPQKLSEAEAKKAIKKLEDKKGKE
jgi:hypothetical protein